VDDLAKGTIGRWERLEADRQVSKAHWHQSADDMLPERNGYLSTKTRGSGA
jgi:hypothetical protein